MQRIMTNNKILPKEEIENLGYTIQEFIDLGVFSEETIEEYRKHPLQMVIGKFLFKGKIQLQGRLINVKPMTMLVMDLLDFIGIWNQTQGKAITGVPLKINVYQGQNLDNKKLLLWSFGCGWGDLLFMQAILRYIKKEYPTCKITWAVPQKYHNFVKSFNTVDKIVATPIEYKYIGLNTYHMHFDGVINLFKNARKFNCYELMSDFVNLKIPREELVPKIPVNKQALKYINSKVVFPDNTILLHLKTSSPKRNPSEIFKINITNKLLDAGYYIVFVDSAAQKEEIKALINRSSNPNKCFNFSGITRNMIDVTALLSLVKCVVSVDTSIIHMACAVGIPTYGLYGPFNGEIRVGTYHKNKFINGTCSRSPCCEHGLQLCDQTKGGYPICYDSIDLDMVVEDVNVLVNEKEYTQQV